MEAQLAKQVDEYLKTLGESCWFLNVQGGGTQKAGVPDRLVCYKGIFIGLELKRPDEKGKTSPRQEIEMAKISAAGGFAFICTDVEQLKMLMAYIDGMVKARDTLLREFRKN